MARRIGSGFWYGLILVVALCVFVLALAPAWLMARLVDAASGGEVALERWSGSFWQGRAALITLPFPDGSRQRLENFSWRLMPSSLLRGALSAQLAVADPRVQMRGIVTYADRKSAISDLNATMPARLLATVVPAFALWQPGGTLAIDAAGLTLSPIAVTAPATVNWNMAALTLSEVKPLGDYQVKLAPIDNRLSGDNALSFDLQTPRGALLVTGNGRYAPTTGGDFRGQARAAAGFEQRLAPLLAIMGRQNGDGSVNLAVGLPALR